MTLQSWEIFIKEWGVGNGEWGASPHCHFERSKAESRKLPAKKFPAVMKDNGIMAGRKS